MNVDRFTGSSGTELVMKPDTLIFGSAGFSLEILNNWLKQRVTDMDTLKVDVKLLQEYDQQK